VKKPEEEKSKREKKKKKKKEKRKNTRGKVCLNTEVSSVERTLTNIGFISVSSVQKLEAISSRTGQELRFLAV